MGRIEGRKERFIQFGEGGFLRGFADWMIQKLNDKTDFSGSVVVVQPIETGLCHLLEAQGCDYTHIIRGSEGVEIDKIDVISRTVEPYKDFNEYLLLAEIPEMRFIISNTTEAGIVFCENECERDAPKVSFPAKLTLLLKRRFELSLPGFIILPCELIDRNGDNLLKAIISYAKAWGYSEEFIDWVKRENVFTNTLVDRINTGYPRGEENLVPYEDKMLNTSEYFHLWVIETDFDIEAELPFRKAGLNVIVTKSELEKYRTRKVRILNGAHTSLVCHAMLLGFDTVKSCLDDEKMYSYVKTCIFDEIIPTLDLPKNELTEYAESVLTRFSNPYIKHYLASISLNSVSKFKARVLPSILEHKKRFGIYPKTLVFSLMRLIEFYKADMANDLPDVVEYIKSHSREEILKNSELWGEDISDILNEVKYDNK